MHMFISKTVGRFNGINKRGITTILCTTILFLMFLSVYVEAQIQDGQWSVPYRLSSSEGEYLHCSNRVVADQYGYAHAFWFEEGFSDRRSVIQYARLDDEGWTTPLDIHAVQPNVPLDQLSVTVDQNNILHLAWTEGGPQAERPIYYTQVPAHKALSAQNWQTPIRIDVPARHIKLRVDSKNILHLLYSKFFEPQPGIYYLRSEDQGETWSDPVWLDSDIPLDHSPESLEFELDDTDGLHVVWNTNPLGSNAVGGGWVRYVHSLDGGNSWSLPFTIDKEEDESGGFRLSFPGPLLAVQGQTVHVVWAGGDQGYRNHRFSIDAGQTWSNPFRKIFGNLNGQAWDGMITDEVGRVHFLGQIRYPQGIWHAYWDQDHWTGPSLVYLIVRTHTEPIGDHYHAHCIRSAIREGNQLVTTFYDRSDEKPFVLYSTHRQLNDISQNLIQPTPTLLPVPTSTSTPLSNSPSTSPTSTPTRTVPQFDTNIELPSDNMSGPASAVWLALIPTFLLVTSVIAFQVLKKR